MTSAIRVPVRKPSRVAWTAAWLLVGVGSLTPLPAGAAPLPADLSVEGTTHVVAEVREGRTFVELRVGARALGGWEVAGPLDEVAMEPASSAGRPVLILRGRGRGIEVAALLDPRPRPRWIWHGRTDLHGDPGERVADVLEERDFDADGRVDLLVGQRRDGVASCGEATHLLFPRALDARGQLRPVRSLVVTEGLPSLVAQAAGEGPRPRVVGARFTAASSQAGLEADASLLGPPLGLTDGDPATGWAEGRGEAGVGEVVRGQWAGPRITSLLLEGGEAATLPRRFVLALDAARFVVLVPEALGQRARVVLPEPTRASCVSIVLADERPRGDDARIGFTELAVYSVADEADGMSALVAELVAESQDGDRAVGWLAAAGPPAVLVVDDAWERLGALGRRRALRVAAAIARAPAMDAETLDRVRSMRRRAASDEDADVRTDAIEALRAADDAGRLALLEISLDPRQPGHEQAASALASGAGAPASSWEVLRGLLDPPDAGPPDAGPPAAGPPDAGPEEVWGRPAVRAAFALRLSTDASWQDRMRDRSTPAHPAALAGLASGLAEAVPSSEARDVLIRSLLERAISELAAGRESFETRFRVARTARAAWSEAIDAWLLATATGAEEWMLRSEAVLALGPRASRELLATLLRDPYPRVRLAAARAVAARGSERATLMALSRHDAWPLVRAFAMGEVVDEAEGRAMVIEALRDPASAVRQRSLELLRTRGGPDVTGPVLAILEDTREWPHVTSRAIELADTQCAEDLGPGLVALVSRGARANASAPELDNAQAALRVALRLGGETAAQARRVAQTGPSAAVFASLLERTPAPCGRGYARGVPSAP